MPGAEQVELHVQVGRASGPRDRDAGDVGDGAQVLVVVGLIDDEVVDAGGLEGEPGVLDGVELFFEAFLGGGEGGFHPLDRQRGAAAGGAGRVDPLLELGDLPVEIGALGVGPHRKPLERRAGEDDGVPVAGRDPADELAAPLAGEVVAARGQDPRPWVDGEELARELVEHVVGDDDRGFADHTDPAGQF